MSLTIGLAAIANKLEKQRTSSAEVVVKYARDVAINYHLLVGVDAAMVAAARYYALSTVLGLLDGWKTSKTTEWSTADLEAWLVAEVLRNATRGSGFGGSSRASPSAGSRLAAGASLEVWAGLLDAVKYGRI